MGIIIVDNNY